MNIKKHKKVKINYFNVLIKTIFRSRFWSVHKVQIRGADINT